MPTASNVTDQKKVLTSDQRLAQLACSVEKKIKYLEETKAKLDDCKKQLTPKGKTLKDVSAVESYQMVVSNLEEYQCLSSEMRTIIKMRNVQKKLENKLNVEYKIQHDSDRLLMGFKFRDILYYLQDEKVREDFLAGNHGAVKLDEANLEQIDKLNELISMPAGDKRSLNHVVAKEKISNCALSFGLLLDGVNKPFQNTTYKNLKILLNAIYNCSYPKQLKPKRSLKVVPASNLPQQQQSVAAPSLPQQPQSVAAPSLPQQPQSVAAPSLPQQQPVDFNPSGIMSNGFRVPAPMNYNRMMPMQSTYFGQNHIGNLDVRELVMSSNINFLQESQLSPEPAPIPLYMDPAVVSFGTIQPESLMQMHEQQIMHHTPAISPPVILAEEPRLVYQAIEQLEECQPQIEQVVQQPPAPVMTSWAEETNDRWPNEINGESNIWNGNAESNAWADNLDDKRSYRRPANRRPNNFGSAYRGRGYVTNYNNGNRGGNSFGNNNYNRGRGNGSSYNRGTTPTYRAYRGGYQTQRV